MRFVSGIQGHVDVSKTQGLLASILRPFQLSRGPGTLSFCSCGSCGKCASTGFAMLPSLFLPLIDVTSQAGSRVGPAELRGRVPTSPRRAVCPFGSLNLSSRVFEKIGLISLCTDGLKTWNCTIRLRLEAVASRLEAIAIGNKEERQGPKV